VSDILTSTGETPFAGGVARYLELLRNADLTVAGTTASATPAAADIAPRPVRVTVAGASGVGKIAVGDHVLLSDVGSAVQGHDLGPDPMELLLSAVGASLARSVLLAAARREVVLDRVEVDVQLVDGTIVHRIDAGRTAGADIGPEQLEDVSTEARAASPVLALVQSTGT
jgi:uncharacterized OsmC-like protein